MNLMVHIKDLSLESGNISLKSVDAGLKCVELLYGLCTCLTHLSTQLMDQVNESLALIHCWNIVQESGLGAECSKSIGYLIAAGLSHL